MKKVLLIMLALMMTLMMFAACAQQADEPETQADEQEASADTTADEPEEPEADTEAESEGKEPSDIVIAVVPKALDNPIFIDAKVAAEAAGEELGITVLYTGSTNSDAAEQVNVIEGLISKGVDAMLISCNDADALKDVINKATDQGIHVATFDSDSPDSKRLFYIGTDNYNAGKTAAEYMQELLPDGGKVALLTGVLGAPNLEERIQGFKDTCEGTNIEILPIQTGDDDVATSVEVVNQFTLANPDLDGWWFVGGWPFFADEEALVGLKQFRENGGKVVSIDTFHPMLKYVELDYADQLIGSNYTAMGDQGVRMLYDAIMGNMPTTDNVDTGFEFCDISNVEEVLATKTPW